MTRLITLIALCATIGAALVLGVSGASAGPVSNDCSGGNVYFTFDDGPDPVSTPAVMQQLASLNIKATFFVNGIRIGDPGGAAVIQQEVANGYQIGNHTWDHQSFTGASTGTTPMTGDQVAAELNQASDAIVAAGAPYPALYRPPYGDINSYDDLIARDAGYRIVMPWGQNIVDSQDWKGISSAQITSNVINGYVDQFGNFKPGMKADSIISFHDGAQDTAPNTIAALPAIADRMNTLHLCSSLNIRQDATGGAVPTPAPPEPTSGNLVQNPSLEQLRVTGNHSEPVCFQQGGASPNSHNTNWSLTADTHSGTIAERLDESNWSAGDAKLVLTQRQSERSCLAAVTPGKTYTFWTWYKGDWAYQGPGFAKTSIATYYMNAQNQWVYWQGGPLMPPTNGVWNLASFTSAPLPAGAQAVSFGLALQGNGTLITDDYAMVQN